jgi:hypothetical protein
MNMTVVQVPATTPEDISRNSHIPTAEIQQDILETEQEITVMEREIRALETTPPESADYKLAFFRASAKRTGIVARQVFIARLLGLLAARGVEFPAQGNPVGR